MGDYLLCHAAFVLPVAFACYKTDGNLKKIKRNTAYLNKMIDANIEGYHAMNAIDEMSVLNNDLKKFFDLQGIDYPMWKELENECTKYLK